MHSVDPANIDVEYINGYRNAWPEAVKEAYGSLLCLSAIVPLNAVDNRAIKEYHKPFAGDKMRPQINAFNSALSKVAKFMVTQMENGKKPTLEQTLAEVKCDL